MLKIYLFPNIHNLLCIFLCFILKSFTFSQTSIEESFQYKISRFLNDSGEGWETISHFYDSNYYKKNINQLKKPLLKNLISVRSSNENISFSLLNNGSFKNFFVYSYLSLGVNGQPFHLYKEIDENKYKATGNQYNILFSGIGYKNDWSILKISRGMESWGAGENINLALSEHSFPYDYITLGSDYGRLRVKYIHGLLETTSRGINRFLIAKGIEFSNKRSFLLGVSETIIYSGLNRPLDIAYLNPVSSHLETELNNRLQIRGDGNSNAVWQLHLDALFKEKIRVSLNALIDEFVFDPDIEIGKENGKAFSFRISYKLLNLDERILAVHSKYIYVGTPTFRHGIGTNNFVHNMSPLGWPKGSDAEEFSLGFNYFNKKSFIFSLNAGYIFSGDENILFRPFDRYNDYQKSSFPSGDITKNIFLNLSTDITINKYLTFMSILNLSYKNNNKVLLGFNASLPFLI